MNLITWKSARCILDKGEIHITTGLNTSKLYMYDVGIKQKCYMYMYNVHVKKSFNHVLYIQYSIYIMQIW